MKRILPLIIVFLPLAALGQSSVTLITEPVEAVVTVTKVDRKGRTVTIRGPAGNLHTLAVPKEAKNLDQVKPGDRFRIVGICGCRFERRSVAGLFRFGSIDVACAASPIHTRTPRSLAVAAPARTQPLVR